MICSCLCFLSLTLMSIPAAELRLVDSIQPISLCCYVQDTFLTQCVPSVTADRRVCCLPDEIQEKLIPTFLLDSTDLFFFCLFNSIQSPNVVCGNTQGSGLECPIIDFSFYTAILSKLIIYPCVYKYHFMYTISDCSSWYQLASF